MMMVNIADAKAKLSELIEAASRGEQVIICNRNQPVAELRRVEAAQKTPRDMSPLFPDWKIDPAFYEPLPDEFLNEFYNGPLFPTEAKGEHAARVAERPAGYAAPRRRTKRRS